MTNTFSEMKMDKIAVLIPCYNEELTIGKVVRDFRAALPDAAIYVYNNNSTDNTVREAENAGAIVRNEFRQGKGNVLRRMFREIDASVYVLVDGDDTYPAEPAGEMVQMVRNGADMVVGDRLSSTYSEENKRPFHDFGNKLVRKSINMLFKSDIRDIMTGYRAFSYEFIKTFPVLSERFEIETEMSIHAVDKNLSVQNYVIDYRDRPEGSQSKLNTYSDGIKVLKTIINLYRTYKPIGFFAWITLGLLILALIFFIPIVLEYIYTGLVPNFPTLIVCGFTVIAAIQSLFTGLTLQTIVKKNRQDFEMQFHRASERRKELEM